jgi:threonylcarbamoyladenosine tRNA methylthiotransferase MtaB
MKKVALHNLGCKVNAYETEAMQEMLEKAGYEIVPFQEGADIYIVNTCTVTNIADRKSRQMLHRARKLNPQAIVVATGCYVQAQEEVDPCIDVVIGNNKKQDLIPILEAATTDSVSMEKVDLTHPTEYEELELSHTGEHTRAYIKVQDGCNQFCSYCIIPYARGRVRSRTKADVLKEVERLAQNGYQEVVLTGIHLSSYGVDLQEEETLLSLICAVHEVEGVKRIRLGSLEPRIITKEFVETLSKLTKFCPHFHLSLQSGCDETLKRMNRRYTSAEYRAACELLRAYFEHPALTTDVIVGFPGETQDAFEASLAFVDSIDFYEVHVFKYSKRQGTKAADMPDQIPEQVKAARSAQMIAMQQEHMRAFEAWYQGKEVEVLIEETVEIDGQLRQVGHTREYIKIALEDMTNLQNCMVNIEIGNHSQIIH